VEIAVSVKELLEAGVHFGHQTRRWNPKMKPFIFEKRNGIYIIDLQQSVTQLQEAILFAQELASTGGKILFVGTKKQAQESIREAANQSESYYVNERWLGGTLTNIKTIRKSVQRYIDLEEMDKDGSMAKLSKKEASSLRREKNKLEKNLIGIKGMEKLPACLFVVDTKREEIAIAEALKLNIPIIAILDTNCDPDQIKYPIAGNDDAIKSIRLISFKIAEAIQIGRQSYAKIEAEQAAKAKKEQEEAEKKSKAEAAKEAKVSKASATKEAKAEPAKTEIAAKAAATKEAKTEVAKPAKTAKVKAVKEEEKTKGEAETAETKKESKAAKAKEEKTE